MGWLTLDDQPLGCNLGKTIQSVHSYGDDQGTLYHVVNLDPQGFVIVSGDDLVTPIVAFSSNGAYDPSPDDPLGTMVNNDLPQRVNEARELEKSAASAGIAFQPQGRNLEARNHWKMLAGGVSIQAVPAGLAAVSDVRVEPLVQTRWNQQTACGNATFNYYVPPYDEGTASNYPCGCVATAMAQTMRYHCYPTTGVGTGCFTIQIDGAGTTECLRGGNGLGSAYAWSEMPFIPNCSTTLAQRQAIGALCHDAGVALNMSYSSGGSGADVLKIPSSLRNTFHYGNAKSGYKSSGLTTVLPDMLNPNLDAGLPTILGIRGNPGGHAVVCDGYGFNVSTAYHHLNLGWAGTNDAWYNLPTVDTVLGTFTMVTAVIYNIYPDGSGEIISGRVTDTNGNPVSGVNISATKSGGMSYGPALTDIYGIYAIVGVPSDTTLTVSAQKTGYTFTSQVVTTGTSVDYDSATGNRWGVDFVGVEKFRVSWFAINSGSTSTPGWTVTLNNTCSSTPSAYMASESSSFTGASWQTYSAAPAFTVSAGETTKRIYFKARNSTGTETTAVYDDITIDVTPPLCSASNAGGVYSSPKNIVLSANEASKIYYTTDGSEPGTGSAQYSAPIALSSDTTLRFFAVDRAGNAEAAKHQEKYWILSGDSLIASTKSAADGTQVRLGNKVLYTKRAGFGYIQEPGSYVGLRIEGEIPASAGQSVNLVGKLVTTAGVEKRVLLTALTPVADAQIEPVGVNNRLMMFERMLDGLYVRVWGRVKPGSITDSSYILYEGIWTDGMLISTPGAPGVTEDQFVIVTGAAGYDGNRIIYSD